MVTISIRHKCTFHFLTSTACPVETLNHMLTVIPLKIFLYHGDISIYTRDKKVTHAFSDLERKENGLYFISQCAKAVIAERYIQQRNVFLRKWLSW